MDSATRGSCWKLRYFCRFLVWVIRRNSPSHDEPHDVALRRSVWADRGQMREERAFEQIDMGLGKRRGSHVFHPMPAIKLRLVARRSGLGSVSRSFTGCAAPQPMTGGVAGPPGYNTGIRTDLRFAGPPPGTRLARPGTSKQTLERSNTAGSKDTGNGSSRWSDLAGGGSGVLGVDARGFDTHRLIPTAIVRRGRRSRCCRAVGRAARTAPGPNRTGRTGPPRAARTARPARSPARPSRAKTRRAR